MFDFDVFDEFKISLRKLAKKYNKRGQIVKKITEIIFNTIESIDRYHNCSYNLKKFKHENKSFFIIFEFVKAKHFIYFHKLGHHDDFSKK
jgi:mRNA-degrading endonuclease RelE of RelBE toxin-antitoxin system